MRNFTLHIVLVNTFYTICSVIFIHKFTEKEEQNGYRF